MRHRRGLPLAARRPRHRYLPGAFLVRVAVDVDGAKRHRRGSWPPGGTMRAGVPGLAAAGDLRSRCATIGSMVKTLKAAIDEVATLPAADQEEIARQLLAHVEKIRRLRADVQAGVAALDRGDFEEVADEDLDARLDDLAAPARR
jgi:hypothetical protein